MPLVVTATMKPISSTAKGIASVDLITREPRLTVYERSDTCAVPRACIIGEAMMAFVVADALIEKVGGDSVGEMAPRFARLTSMRLDDIHLEGAPWRFAYEVDL
jgi:chorismate synthase